MERKNAHVTAFHFFTWYFNVYPLLAPPAFIQMDNGGEFALIAVWMGAVPGCQVIRSIRRIPASNALVERSIGSLKRILAKQIHIRHQAYIAITKSNIHAPPRGFVVRPPTSAPTFCCAGPHLCAQEVRVAAASACFDPAASPAAKGCLPEAPLEELHLRGAPSSWFCQ